MLVFVRCRPSRLSEGEEGLEEGRGDSSSGYLTQTIKSIGKIQLRIYLTLLIKQRET